METICGDIIASMSRAPSGGVVSEHEYLVSIVTARSVKGDAVWLAVLMDLRVWGKCIVDGDASWQTTFKANRKSYYLMSESHYNCVNLLLLLEEYINLPDRQRNPCDQKECRFWVFLHHPSHLRGNFDVYTLHARNSTAQWT